MEVKCDNCRKKFKRRKSHVIKNKNVFCSRLCSYKWVKKQRPWISCDFCGKEFQRTKVKIKHPHNFCSKKCFNSWLSNRLSISRKGKNNPAWKGGKLTIKCKYCRKKFEIYPSQVKTRKYCSLNCKSKAINPSGRNSHFWKGGKLKKRCKTCNKDYYVFPCLKDSEFCSTRCSTMWNNAYIHTKRTNLEKIVKNILERLSIDFDEQIIIEDICISDFFISSKQLIIFVDGEYWHSLPKAQKRDKKQNALLRKRGYDFIRIPESLIKNDIKKVERILKKKCLNNK